MKEIGQPIKESKAKNRNVLILYYEVMPYNIEVFKGIVKMGYCLKVVQRDNEKLTPYVPPKMDGVEIVNLSTFKSYERFKDYCLSTNPATVLICEGKVKWYWWISKCLHNQDCNLPIICGSDAQWTGNRNNWIKRFGFSLFYGNFTHILCAGQWQVVYATKIGFKRHQILTPFYCADTSLYHTVDIEKKVNNYPKRFVYIGQLIERKGLSYLLDAWNNIKDKKGWTLTMIGNGAMYNRLSACKDIELLPFMDQKEICKVLQESGCQLMPSLYEPWGLVLHEAAAAGMPVIVTRNFGAASQFAVNAKNGYVIPEGNTNALQKAMEHIIDAPIEDLIAMSKYSRDLSERIRPTDVAAAITSQITQ